MFGKIINPYSYDVKIYIYIIEKYILNLKNNFQELFSKIFKNTSFD